MDRGQVMAPHHLKLGTRGSKLALRQAQLVAAHLRRIAPAMEVRVEVVTTRGDRLTSLPLAMVGETGVFVKELEAALLDDRVQAAVHSMKDLPTTAADGLAIAAVPSRDDPRDALISRSASSLAALPKGARVGTSSPRRRAQLLHVRPDLEVRELRGNLDTRLRLLAEGIYDAIVVAAAGLRRMGLAGHVAEFLPFHTMVPAPGQGALAIEVREDDEMLLGLFAQLDDPPARSAVNAERAFMGRLGAGCFAPVGALAETHDGVLTLTGCIVSPDGVGVVRGRLAGSPAEPERLGEALADRLLHEGGWALLGARPDEPSMPHTRVQP